MLRKFSQFVLVAALLAFSVTAFAQQRGQGPKRGENMLFKIRNMSEEQVAARKAAKEVRKAKLEEEIASGCSKTKERLEHLVKFDAFVKKVVNMSDEEFSNNRDELKEEFVDLTKPPKDFNGFGKRGKRMGRGMGMGLMAEDADEALDAIHNMDAEELALHEARTNLHKKRLTEDIENGCLRAKERLERMEKMSAFTEKVRSMSDEEFEANIDNLKAELKELRPKKKGMGFGPKMGGHGRHGRHGQGMGRGMGNGF